jgi:ankyrin repeat protein
MFQHGADAAGVCNADTGDTLLHEAARSRQLAVLDLLLSRGVSVNAPNKAKETALHVACAAKAVASPAGGSGAAVGKPDSVWDVVSFLVRRGCDVDARTALGDTPLQVAQRGANADVQLLLSQSGAALRPVSRACERGTLSPASRCVCAYRGANAHCRSLYPLLLGVPCAIAYVGCSQAATAGSGRAQQARCGG